MKIGPNQPTLQRTLLGWIVSGKYVGNLNPPPKLCSTLCQAEEEFPSIISVDQKCWALEELPLETNGIKFTPEQKVCVKFFVNTTQILPSGRLQVSMPIKFDRKLLGHS